MPSSTSKTLTPEHKAALAEGRRSGRAVRAYLDAIEHKPRRSPRLSKEEVEKRLAEVREKLIANDLDPVTRVKLIQQRIDLEQRLAHSEDDQSISELEQKFIAAAKTWAVNHGVTYQAFREGGVPVEVLKEAGIAA